jgi:hypothetical protein
MPRAKAGDRFLDDLRAGFIAASEELGRDFAQEPARPLLLHAKINSRTWRWWLSAYQTLLAAPRAAVQMPKPLFALLIDPETLVDIDYRDILAIDRWAKERDGWDEGPRCPFGIVPLGQQGAKEWDTKAAQARAALDGPGGAVR